MAVLRGASFLSSWRLSSASCVAAGGADCAFAGAGVAAAALLNWFCWLNCFANSVFGDWLFFCPRADGSTTMVESFDGSFFFSDGVGEAMVATPWSEDTCLLEDSSL